MWLCIIHIELRCNVEISKHPRTSLYKFCLNSKITRTFLILRKINLSPFCFQYIIRVLKIAYLAKLGLQRKKWSFLETEDIPNRRGLQCSTDLAT